MDDDFTGFQCEENGGAAGGEILEEPSDEEEVIPVKSKQKKKKPLRLFPKKFHFSKWLKREEKLKTAQEFTTKSGMNFTIPEDTAFFLLEFLFLFLTPEVVEDITFHTNYFAKQIQRQGRLD